MIEQSGAQALAELAKQNYQSGNLQAAVDAFKQAAQAYDAGGDRLMAAEMMNNCSVALLRSKMPEAALQAAHGTDAVFAEAGDLVRQGIALTNLGSACEALKNIKDAIEYYIKAGKVFEQAGEGEMNWQVMKLLSSLYLRRVNLLDSIIAMQSGLAGVKKPQHRTTYLEKISFYARMNSGADFKLRPVVMTDQRQISNLIHFSANVHRHLDWRNPLDWIGNQPFFVIEQQGQIIAALGCPPDPPEVAWIRLYAHSEKITTKESWDILWQQVETTLSARGKFIVAAILTQNWFQPVLTSSGFTSHQSIVMLERNGTFPLDEALPEGITLRPMMAYDLQEVAEVDHSAFEILWHNPETTLARAFPQAVWPSVAESSGSIVGYQLGTRNSLGIHLARLAVRPEMQGKRLGYALAAALIRQAHQYGITHFTVNTQNDNIASLALYQRMGFVETGETYPVFQINNR